MSRSTFAVGFTNHRKIRKLSDAAFRMWVTAIDHAKEDGTDGVIKPDDLDTFQRCPVGKARAAAIQELVTNGLWHECEDGWLIHDFLDWQSSAEEEAARRARDRERMRLLRSGERTSERSREQDPEQPSERHHEQPPEPTSEQQANSHAQNPGAPLGTPSDQDPGFKLGTEGSGSPELPVKTSIPGGRARRKSRLPDGWEPKDRHRARASELGLNFARELERFRLHAQATGRVMLDWDATFTTWLINAERFAGETGKRGGGFKAQGDDAEARRSRRNNLIDDAKAGRYGRDVALRARRPGEDLGRLADELENAPAPNVAQLLPQVGRTLT